MFLRKSPKTLKTRDQAYRGHMLEGWQQERVLGFHWVAGITNEESNKAWNFEKAISLLLPSR